MDSSGGAIPGATVNVRNVATQVSRDAVTDAAGGFVIADLLAGTYDVTVSLTGFKTYVQTAVVLSANERVALRAIALQVGALSETISVTAEAARVQTQSSERSGLITQDQLKEVTLKGRDYMGMLKLLPGVVDTANREAPGWNNIGGLAINGGRNNTINLTYDGVTNLDTGSNTGPFLAPGLDSIAEIKVLTSNYQAEYGRSSGGTINVITKSGSRDLHGGGFYSKRSKRFNANEWQNNKTGAPKPPYRIRLRRLQRRGPHRACRRSIAAATSCSSSGIRSSCRGLTPARCNCATCRPSSSAAATSPDPFDNNGNLIVIRDPSTGLPFLNNMIPAGRIDPNGQALLNRLSGAERRRPAAAVQLHVPELLRPPAQRPGPPRRLERRLQHHVLFAPELRLRGLQGRLGIRVEQRQLAAAADCVRDPQLRDRQYPAPHFQPDARR